MGKENLFKRLRSAMGVSAIKDMTPKEINDVFQSLHDKNVKLSEEVEHIKKHVKELEKSLEWSLGCHNFDKYDMPEAYALWEHGYSLLQLRKEQE